MPQTDVLIIGSGIAAISAACQLQKTKHVTILTKGAKVSSNSMLAQGGIAAAIRANDSYKSHSEDTLNAGHFHNDEEAVELLVREGAKDVLSLAEKGLPFDRDSRGELLLGMEGAHSFSRILHAGGDATGRAMMRFLLSCLNENTVIHENEMVLELIVENGVCLGAVSRSQNGLVNRHTAQHTILATGGCGKLYLHSSNADGITGDGLALGYRAGAVLADMEFTQFHPTMLLAGGGCAGLISEAVRGEGAFLQNDLGERIMEGIHPLKDLAPRDIVARVIFSQIKKGRSVYLNILPVLNFEERFPTITAMCRKYNIVIENGLLPVAPGMHFLMGGIKTDLHGRTSVSRLYAAGETACTGVHGANRLASNSLLEGLVFGKRLANKIQSIQETVDLKTDTQAISHPADIELPEREDIQQVMTAYAGIERTEEELAKALHWFEKWLRPYWAINVKDLTNDSAERLNMMTSGWLIVSAALQRTESRGGHCRLDFPDSNDAFWLKKQILLSKKGCSYQQHSEVKIIEFT
ncbi:L-aspartate oxidase [Metabacillus indicus]|uniref:L-aspartate oxidase n=1 Tax=Metabacillus indicus TaxID=246786 RepID=UPI000AA3CEAD|nr:L-aspartate oxidase [Metabacillus indicus]